MKIILTLSTFFFINSFVMAQKVEFTTGGLDILELNTKVSDIKNIPFDKIEYHNGIRSDYKGGFSENFLYYYIKLDSAFIEHLGLIKDIFFATDSTNKVRSIFLVLKYSNEKLELSIDKTFGHSLLQSYSSIGNTATTSKKFWKKDGTTVFLIEYSQGYYSKIVISNISVDEKSPGINIETMYK